MQENHTGVADRIEEVTAWGSRDLLERDLVTLRQARINDLPTVDALDAQHIATARGTETKARRTVHVAGGVGCGAWRLAEGVVLVFWANGGSILNKLLGG